MAGAGFYAIHTSKLSFHRDGRWYADDEPVIHERLARLFSRYVRRRPTGKGYEIWIDERYHADIEVEDTPFVVTSVVANSDGTFALELNDGTVETLDPTHLTVGDAERMYCLVKQGTERALLLRTAYYQLAEYIDVHADDTFHLRAAGQTYSIAYA